LINITKNLNNIYYGAYPQQQQKTVAPSQTVKMLKIYWICLGPKSIDRENFNKALDNLSWELLDS